MKWIWFKNFLLLGFLGSLSGCGSVSLPFLSGPNSLAHGGGSTSVQSVPRGPSIEVQSVNLVADQDANDNSAVPVEYIVVYDQHVFVKLLGMTARQYFQQERQLKSDNPNIIESWRWEVIPGQALVDQPAKYTGSDPVGAIVFADYTSPGDHRIRVGAGEQIRIELKKDAFYLTTRNKN